MKLPNKNFTPYRLTIDLMKWELIPFTNTLNEWHFLCFILKTPKK